MKHKVINDMLALSVRAQNKLDGQILVDAFTAQAKNYILDLRELLLSKDFTQFIDDNPTYTTTSRFLYEYTYKIEALLNVGVEFDVNKYTAELILYVNRIVVELSYMCWHLSSTLVDAYFEPTLNTSNNNIENTIKTLRDTLKQTSSEPMNIQPSTSAAENDIDFLERRIDK